MKTAAALLITLALALPAGAQPGRRAPKPRGPVAADDAPKISYRPYFLVSGEAFAATHSFDAAFGQSFQPFYGGGVELALNNGLFVDVGASRFKKTGQRAFFFNNQAFGLGIPLTATVTPFEVAGGYRFLHVARRIIPYAGAGVGSYGYKETSQFADASENVDARHAGFLVRGGAEFRLHRWVGAAVDAQYTHVTGILGTAGVSKEAGEKDLGGTAIRFRVLVGR
jgi:opacity protein-like surface antigen